MSTGKTLQELTASYVCIWNFLENPLFCFVSCLFGKVLHDFRKNSCHRFSFLARTIPGLKCFQGLYQVTYHCFRVWEKQRCNKKVTLAVCELSQKSCSNVNLLVSAVTKVFLAGVKIPMISVKPPLHEMFFRCLIPCAHKEQVETNKNIRAMSLLEKLPWNANDVGMSHEDWPHANFTRFWKNNLGYFWPRLPKVKVFVFLGHIWPRLPTVKFLFFSLFGQGYQRWKFLFFLVIFGQG